MAKPKFNHVRLAPSLQSFDMLTKLDGSLILVANLSGKFGPVGSVNIMLSKAQLTGFYVASLTPTRLLFTPY